jgi:hypothetical protein
MKRSPILLALFGVVAVAQLAVPASMIAQRELTLRTGELLKFRTAPVDPYDAFRGRYVALGFTQTSVSIPEGMELRLNQKVFVLLEGDAEGFAQLKAVSLEQPSDARYLAMPVNFVSGNTAHFRLPFDRFYMQEHLAPEAERVYLEHSRAGKRTAYIAVRVRRGHGVIENLYIEDTPIAEYVRARLSAQ